MRSILFLVLLLLSACGGTPDSCRLETLATLPVRQLGNVPVVTAEINGRPATLVLDTGSDATVLNRTAARRLGVAETGPARSVGAAGGIARVSPARLDSLTLGGFAAGPVRAALADAPAPPLDGVLGLNVLNAFELDLDVPGGQATFYKARLCAGVRPGWSLPTVQLPAQMVAGSGHLFVSAAVDGEPLRGMLDTGASITTLSVQAAEDVRVNQHRLRQLPGTRSQALNAGGIVIRRQAFDTLKLGTDVLDRPVLSIADLPPFAGDMLIGADYLATRRVWFAFALGQVFVPGNAPP